MAASIPNTSMTLTTGAVQYANVRPSPSTAKSQTVTNKVLTTSLTGQEQVPYIGSGQRMASNQTFQSAPLMRTLGPSQSIRTYYAKPPISTASLSGAVNSSSARAPNSSDRVLPVREAKVLGGGIYAKTDEDLKIKIEAKNEDADTNSDPQFSPQESSLEGTNSDADSDKNVEVKEELRDAEIEFDTTAEVKEELGGVEIEPDTNTEVKEEMRGADVEALPEVSEQTVDAPDASESEPQPDVAEIEKIDWELFKQDAESSGEGSKPRTMCCTVCAFM